MELPAAVIARKCEDRAGIAYDVGAATAFAVGRARVQVIWEVSPYTEIKIFECTHAIRSRADQS